MLHGLFLSPLLFPFQLRRPLMHQFLLCNHISPVFHFQLRGGERERERERERKRKMLPYVETLYVSGTSPADQEKIMISSTTSSLVSPCHGHQPAAAFSSFPWFPLSPFAFDQGLQVFPIDEEVAHIVEEELNASTEMPPPSDPPAADHMTEVITVTVAPSVQAANAAAAALPEEKKNNARKRFRTDRHSKIHTSQGLRDRRMRLSLDVARQFFDLQDMLGFDKASHTISWLLTQSKEAIAQLTTRSSPGANRQAFNSPLSSFGSNDSSSEGEAISPNPKPPPGGFQPPGAVAPDAKSAKESRDKARARARQRTREKNQKRLLPNACTLDYQLVAAHSKASILAASDSFEVPSNWNVMNDHNPVTRMPSWGFCNSHEEANLMDEQLKIVDPGNKHEDMVISWLM